jgi:protein-disulfide isomerase
MIALLILICTVLNISSNWYLAQGTINPLVPVSLSNNVDKVAEALRQIQYDQAGGKDIYELYMKLQKLQAQGQKSKLEDQIKSLEGGAGANQPAAPAGDPAAPSASKTITDTQYAGIFKDSYVEGNAKAKITLVEYSDLECPYCIMQKKNGTIESLKKKYGDQVNVIFKPLNLARHPGSDQKGWASLCVAKLGGTDKYAKYYNAILNGSEVQGPVYALDKISTLAKEVGVDQKKFDACYNAKDTETLYKSYTTEAFAFAVNGTPTTMIINNQTKTYDLVSGAAPATNFEAVVDKFLAVK